MAGRNDDDVAGRGCSYLFCFDSETCGGSLDSFSFPSQPPDVKDLFSSYEYESPNSSIFESFLFPEEDESETQDPLLHSGNRASKCPPTPEVKKLIQSTNITPNWRSSFLVGSTQSQSPQAKSIAVKAFEGRSSAKHDECHANHHFSRASSIPAEKQSPERIRPSIKSNRQFPQKIDPEKIDFALPVKTNPDLKMPHKFPCEEESRVHYDDLDANKENLSYKSGALLLGSNTSKVIGEKSGLRSELFRKDLTIVIGTKRKVEDEISPDEDEELRKDASSNGFISTKKSDDRKISTGPISTMIHDAMVGAKEGPVGGTNEQSMHRDLTSKGTGINFGCKKEKPEEGTRDILVDITNFPCETVEKNTGKWRCPRKGKPYIKPPLKQLRMEKWVRRVN